MNRDHAAAADLFDVLVEEQATPYAVSPQQVPEPSPAAPPKIEVICADCLAHMRTMPTHSVSVVVTSPPYNLGKKYSLHNDNMPESEYLAWQSEVAKEIARILRPDGHLFLNVGSDSQHPWRDIDVALAYRPHLVLQNRPGWIKSLALDGRSLQDPALRDTMHERTIGHFVSVNSDFYLNPCWEPIYHFTPSGRSRIDRQAIGVRYVWADQPARFGHNRNKHCRGSAWHIPYKTTQSAADRYHHPATFPVELADLCLRLAAPQPDSLALDPFAGTCSTLVAAKALGLPAIGIEIDPNYCHDARLRLAATMVAAAIRPQPQELREATMSEHTVHEAALAKARREQARLQWQVAHMGAWLELERAKGRPKKNLTWGNCIRETGVLVGDKIEPRRGTLVPLADQLTH